MYGIIIGSMPVLITDVADEQEPDRVASLVRNMENRHVSLVCQDRPDLEDYGADLFAKILHEVREQASDVTVEIVLSEMGRVLENYEGIIAEQPEIMRCDLKTVPRLYKKICPNKDYYYTLFVLNDIKKKDSHIITKTSICVGLGEEQEEVIAVMKHARKVGCDIFDLCCDAEELEDGKLSQKLEIYQKTGMELGFCCVNVEER